MADQLRERRLARHLSLEKHVLGREPPLLQRIPDDQLDFIDLERFRQIIVRTLFHRLHGGIRGGEGRDDQDDRFRRGGLDGFQNLHTVTLRHSQIGDDQIKDFFIEKLNGFFTVLGSGHHVPSAFEHDAQDIAQTLLVIND